MQGDFSRRTFDPASGYRAVLLQQGRVLLDADVNEQAEITAHHDEARARDMIGRSGGPASAQNSPGPFAVVGPSSTEAAGWRFTDEAWTALRITGGSYYVDGVLAEGADAPSGGWPLGDQPFLPVIPLGEDADPGLPEPQDNGRYVALLDVWQRQVTADEDASLLESALGGPDTTTRAQAVWQVWLAPIRDGVLCSDLHAEAAQPRTPRRMAAELAPPAASANPCEISASGGYQRLENQLYRVQVHDAPDPSSATAPDGTVLWSRDNGSVVSGVGALDVVSATHAVVTLSRLGRDEELSFRSGQLVELTSRDRELRGLPGFLADAGVPDGFELPVTWRAGGPASLAALGTAPILRRWEGGPAPISAAATELEGGIAVRFPGGGQARTGDYWQIPARTVRLAYGLTQVSGTIEWPPTPGGDVEQPQAGPEHHLTPLAILVRAEGGWSLESDCRVLFPALTDLVTIDQAGGDGQEAMPGDPLPQPVRVAVRNGGAALDGAAVEFTASDDGTLDLAAPPASAGAATLVALTGAGEPGVAQVFWRLNPAGPTTQTLTARRLNDHARPIDVPVVVTGRLSVASQVAWSPDPDCPSFAATRTVQEALQTLISDREMRFLGGDGQTVTAGQVVQRPVRVVVDDGCAPVQGAKVSAVAGNPFTGPGLVAQAGEGEPAPATLAGTGATDRVTVTTGPDGVAQFWWQPRFGNVRWATLDVVLDGSGDAPIRVTANLDASGGDAGRTSGLHIESLRFISELPFRNDDTVPVSALASGIVVLLDGPAAAASVTGKPVIRVELDLPWPVGPDTPFWRGASPDQPPPPPIATQTITLDGVLRPAGDQIRWQPQPGTETWLRDQLFKSLGAVDVGTVLGRLVLDGWAITAENDPAMHVNTHANTVIEDGTGRTRFALPTDDEVTGGQFVQWFHLSRAAVGPGVPVPAIASRTAAVARRALEAAGHQAEVVTEPSADVRKGLVIRTAPDPGVELPAGSTVRVVVSSGRSG